MYSNDPNYIICNFFLPFSHQIFCSLFILLIKRKIFRLFFISKMIFFLFKRRVFVYKALNTFIDDMFAFVIKMPTMHRLSVFRDDIIFFVFLYQRWLYRVDKSRVNEFGQSFEDQDNANNNNNNNVNVQENSQENDSTQAKIQEKREMDKID